MAKKSQPPKRDAKQVWMRAGLLERAEILASRDLTTVGEICNIALREYLTRAGLWPLIDTETWGPFLETMDQKKGETK